MPKLQSNLQIGARIGAGHFGEVFSGQDDIHGEVAVKVMRQLPGQPAGEWLAIKDSLLAEGQHLSQATHRNVVQVYHLLESDNYDAIHLVMEYCRGGSLESSFDKGPMRLSDVRRIANEVCFGLQALHNKGMIHRDIKPSNILRDLQGHAKLGDFGLVTDNIILGYASSAGYWDHVAYEVWGGTGTSVRSDIWALGMTLYRLLHGKEWYEMSPKPKAIIAKGGFANALRWLPHIPKKRRRFIRKMLNDDTDSRYQSANQVMSALAQLPTSPDFSCSVFPTEVRWNQRDSKRRRFVKWDFSSRRNSTWEAWSLPLRGAAGNRRGLGGSGANVAFAVSERQLEDFFAKLP